MLANMSEIEPRADMPPLDWSDLGMNEAVNEPLPTGTVTLLLADVEGSTQPWQTRVDGRNHYPHDIETTVSHASPAIRSGYVAAFSVRPTPSALRTVTPASGWSSSPNAPLVWDAPIPNRSLPQCGRPCRASIRYGSPTSGSSLHHTPHYQRQTRTQRHPRRLPRRTIRPIAGVA